MNPIQDSVIHRFHQNVEKYPDNNAIYVAGKHYTYSELSQISQSIRQQIENRGFQNETLIGVLTIDDIWTYASILAILSLGAAYIPINNKNPAHRNEDIIEDTNLKIILASISHNPIEQIKNNFEIIDSSQSTPSTEYLQPDSFDNETLAYILFTSGSTGRPKGVPISHKNLNATFSVMSDPEFYAFSESDKFLQMFELTFDMSVSSYLLPLCLGACFYVMPQKGISYMNIINLIKEQEITVAQMVPSVISYIERFFNELDFPSVRYSIFAGEALPTSILPEWQKVIPNASIINLYGPTEGTIYCCRYDWSEDAPKEDLREDAPKEDLLNGVVSIGTGWKGIETCILIADKKCIAEPFIKGELCISGDQITTGYWNNATKNKESFIQIGQENSKNIYYRTGDLVSINALGNMVYHGRIDHQVKIDGHRVELGEVEHHVREITKSTLVAAVMKVEKEKSNKQILAVYFESKRPIPETEIIEKLNCLLPPYMIPKEVTQVPAMPINLSGKIDRKKLTQLF